MDPVVSVQNKNFAGNTRNLQKFLEPDRNRKVIYTDNSLEFGKACEDLPGITALQHLIDSRQMASLKEPFEE